MAIAVGDLELRPYTVPHDAAEPLQLRIGDGAHSLGVLTDAGRPTPHAVAHLQHCDALMLECNHDAALLAKSRYPASLKARIGGSHGHLANEHAAALLADCLHGGIATHRRGASERREQPPRTRRRGTRRRLRRRTAGHPDRAASANGMPWLDLR